MSIECNTTRDARYVNALAVAWAAILMYPIGMILLHGALLVAARRSIIGELPPTALSTAISFIWRDFSPDFFWWELVEARRTLKIEPPGCLHISAHRTAHRSAHPP